MSGLVDALTGSGKNYNDQSNSVAAPGPDEQKLIDLQTQLAQQQLNAIQAQQPLNAQLIASEQAGLTRSDTYQKALDAAITPEDQAAAAAAQFKQAQELGPIQTQLAQMQLDALKQGGRATDQQKADIKAATDAAVTAGTSDIDTQTKRGIDMISDELANSRGLRLSDSPIGQEAALLERAAGDQKSSLINNLRANQASATLNYPLAVTGLTSGINLSQQNTNQAFQSFQDQLRQQAQANRLALTGPSIQSGLGLSSIGGNSGAALSVLNSGRQFSTSGSSFDPSRYMSAYGGFIKNVAPSIGALMGGG